MHIAPYRLTPLTIIAAHEVMLAQNLTDHDQDLQKITDLAERFRYAHSRLNNIELKLHENLQTGDRLELLRSLEEARMDYGDARFALSTRNAISSRR